MFQGRAGPELAAPLGVVSASVACARELEDNRATLVLRDPTRPSPTLHIRYTEAIHKALAPGTGYGEFLLARSAMRLEDFQKKLRRAREELQSGIRVTLNGKQEVPIARRIWPDAARVQSLLQLQVVEATVGGRHHHEEPVEIRADVMCDREDRQAIDH